MTLLLHLHAIFLFLSDKISTLFDSFVGDMMDNFVGNLFDLDWKLMVVHMFQMVIAFGLVLPVGFNRESSRQSIGLRTFPLVSLASCCFTLLGFELNSDDDSLMGEVLGGIITGIGFVGGGAILQKDDRIEGTSTAAASWAAGCVGVAVAMGRLEIAVLISVFMVGIFYFVSPLKQKLSKDNDDV